MKYRVAFKVLADFDAEINAESEKEAIKLARDKYNIASLGDFEFLDELTVEVTKL